MPGYAINADLAVIIISLNHFLLTVHIVVLLCFYTASEAFSKKRIVERRAVHMVSNVIPLLSSRYFSIT